MVFTFHCALKIDRYKKELHYEVFICWSESGTIIAGKCTPQASINKEPYSIEITIDNTRKVVGGRCNCVSGINGQCKHTAALITSVNLERTDSCTDTAQQWQKPSKHRQSLYPKGETIQSLYSLPLIEPPTFQKNGKKIEHFLQLMQSENEINGMLFKALTAKSEVVTIDQPKSHNIEPQILSDLFNCGLSPFCARVPVSNDSRTIFKKLESTLPPETETFYSQKIKQDVQGCSDIFVRTIGQANNPAWFIERKCRISASKAHKIFKAKKPETCLKYFFDSAPTTKGMAYGREMEVKARQSYSQKTGNIVIDSGLIVKPGQSWLCSSPDGLIPSENACLEIKCPSSCEGKAIDVSYLQDDKLVTNHIYFTQVQLQMYVSNYKFCHFFVFSEKDSKLVIVERDDNYL